MREVKERIWRRCLEEGEYIVSHMATIRDAAKAFGLSKSQIFKDVTMYLPGINPVLAKEVKEVLAQNKAERHLRGGEATRRKYSKRYGAELWAAQPVSETTGCGGLSANA